MLPFCAYGTFSAAGVADVLDDCIASGVAVVRDMRDIDCTALPDEESADDSNDDRDPKLLLKVFDIGCVYEGV